MKSQVLPLRLEKSNVAQIVDGIRLSLHAALDKSQGNVERTLARFVLFCLCNSCCGFQKSGPNRIDGLPFGFGWLQVYRNGCPAGPARQLFLKIWQPIEAALCHEDDLDVVPGGRR